MVKHFPTGYFDSYHLICTPAQHAEIYMKFDFYWKVYQSDLKIFYKAFIQRNELYSKPSEDEDDDIEPRELTEEEKRMLEMMMGLSKHTMHKRLNNSKS
jgi:hypothetical protein